MSTARVTVEFAFGMLKNRWGILGKRLDAGFCLQKKIAIACAVLHNFHLLNQDHWNDNDFDNPQDQGHDNSDDDVIRDGNDVPSVLMEYIANT